MGDIGTTQTTLTQSDPGVSAAEGGVWWVTVLFSPDSAVRGLSLPLQGRITVGRMRSERVDLVVADRQLSRVHATVSPAPGTAVAKVEDHGSKNGTFVEGERVLSTRYTGLDSVIRVGETLLLLQPASTGSQVEDREFGGRSARLMSALSELDRVAPTSANVLIEGESGVGKELAAARIHRLSERPGDLVAINCATISATLAESSLFGHVRGAFTGATTDAPGLVMEAQDGTLFLDEIGELPLEIQPKLLRLLETGDYRQVGNTRARQTNARIVSATLRDLRECVQEGSFRMDLLGRLQGFRVKLPPLRLRRADILPLFERFARRADSASAPDAEFSMTVEFAEALVRYRWPMNVRELRAVAERLVLLHGLAGPFRVGHLPSEVREGPCTPADLAESDLDTDAEGHLSTVGALRDLRPNPTRQRGSNAGGVDPASASNKSLEVLALQALSALEPRRPPSREQLTAVLRLLDGNVAHAAKSLNRTRKQVYRWVEKLEIDLDQFR